jgi:hypothetical protein
MRTWIASQLSGVLAAPRLALVWALALGGFIIPAPAQPAAKPDLTGRVVLPRTASGVPKVMIFGAAPIGGGAISLAYPDCVKSAQPDAEGQFKIQSLDPELKFRLLIVAPGCKPQLVEGLNPADGPITSYLEAADTNLTTTNSVRGLVLDAKGAPIADALVMLAGVRRDDHSASSGTPRPGYPIAVTDAQGQFVLSSKDPYPGHPRAHVLEVTAEIEARGFVRQKVTIETGGAEAKIVLTEGGGMIEGTVLLPDGRPAEGAFVALRKEGKALTLRNGCLAGSPNDTIATTDAAGHFVLPSDADATALFASHPAGLGKITTNSAITSGGTCKISLQPWGEIEGTFRIGGRLGSNETLELTASGDIGYSVGTTTDGEGRFVFNDVPPVTLQIKRRLGQANGSFLIAIISPVEVRAGEVTSVTLGGTGRPVVGKVLIMPPGETVDWKLLRVELRVDWEQRSYIADLASDGSFRAESIPAGACRVLVTGWEKNIGMMPSVTLVWTNQVVLMPQMPGTGSNEPQDLGTIEVPIHHMPAIGLAADVFATKTLDGQPLQLADDRGKFILLDFAGKLPGPETPAVEAVALAFAGATNFAVITLCNDADPDFLAALSKKKLPWITGKLAGLSNVYYYGVISGGGGSFGPRGGSGWGGGLILPAVFLIGPDGKYVGAKLQAEEIHDAVKAALGAK